MSGVYNEAFGLCISCGGEVEESPYWTPLPAHILEIVRPQVAHLFDHPDKVHVPFFIPPHTKPLCSVECSYNYFKEINGYG
jgi:hypothetical protein